MQVLAAVAKEATPKVVEKQSKWLRIALESVRKSIHKILDVGRAQISLLPLQILLGGNCGRNFLSCKVLS